MARSIIGGSDRARRIAGRSSIERALRDGRSSQLATRDALARPTGPGRIDSPQGFADGRTPVMVATVARRTDAVRALVDAGADVDIRDNRLDNVFLYAGAEGLLDILRIANEAGADPALTNRFGGIALIPASERGHVEVVRYLLAESDVDVDHVNRLGWTALLEAIILSDGGPGPPGDRRPAARGGRRPGPRRRRGRHAARARPVARLRRDRGAARRGRRRRVAVA